MQPIYQKFLIVKTDDDASMEEYSEPGSDYYNQPSQCCQEDIERAKRVW